MLEGLRNPKTSSAWHGFLVQHRREDTMQNLARRWKDLPAHERQAYRPSEEPPVAEAPRIRIAVPSPWPHCGDECYPICEEDLQHVAQHVPVYSAAWKARIGEQPIAPALAFVAPPVHTCQDMLAARGCRDTIGEATLNKVDRLYKRLDRWSALSKPKATPFDEPWGNIFPLFYFGDAPGDDGSTGAAFLMIGRVLKKQVLYMEDCAAPKPEDIITFRPVAANVHSRTSFMDLILPASPAVWLHVEYEQVGIYNINQKTSR